MQSQNLNIQEDSDFKRISELLIRNYKLFIVILCLAFLTAFLVNRFSVPDYKITSSILIKENKNQQVQSDVNDFLNSNLLGKNENFQNELWVIKSTPVIEETIRNLDLTVTYYSKSYFKYADAYNNVPFKVILWQDHPQPINTRFRLNFINEAEFWLEAEDKNVIFYKYLTGKATHQKAEWTFMRKFKLGELIETNDLKFIVQPDISKEWPGKINKPYQFEFKTVATVSNELKSKLEFTVVDKMATVIEISLKTESLAKGLDVVNEIMNVYSEQNLERKNHIASITIDYIEKQLSEISDSLNQTEDNLQSFRSTNQLLNIAEQSNGISAQYMNLQNQLAELITRKRYYDYVADYLLKSENYSNMIVPASLGIQDPLLNNLMAELITAQAQRSNLIENNQEKNPLVQRLNIQIDNVKRTISENISAVGRTTALSIDEMEKRIARIKSEISRLPLTQRQLGNIERKYRLNDAIYNYLLEKHAEAKITKASNLPDNIIIEPSKMVGLGPVSPNPRLNYIIAVLLGLALPFAFLSIKNSLNYKIEAQEDVERLSNDPLLGKILHNRHNTVNVMFDFPKSNIAESFRALRTNLDFYVREGMKKVIMVSSCLEHEGKSFVSINLAMSYAQLGRKTILVNFDLRKPFTYFNEQNREVSKEGLSTFLINKSDLDDIIIHSKYDNLDYIQSGILPPNPVELIALEKTRKLLSILKNNYEIIILDTTPLAQVTDAYLLMDNSDLKIVVVRQNSTLKKVFSLIMKDLHLKKVENICTVLNDNKLDTDQYGYGYGYNNKKKNNKKNRKLRDYYSAIWKHVAV